MREGGAVQVISWEYPGRERQRIDIILSGDWRRGEREGEGGKKEKKGGSE